MKKMEAYQAAQSLGAGFIANVILTQHRNPSAKLNGLVELLKAGHEVRTAQFSIDTLLIDGYERGWEVLESPAVVQLWRGLGKRAA